jgi:DNA-binding NarL/FixJ family response regulator
MFKILLIDRCHFTRTGLEEWLNHSGLFPHSLLVTSLNNLFLAREHILQWKPALIIADLNGFQSEIHHLEQLAPLVAASQNVPFISLHSGEAPGMSAFMQRFPVWASLLKNTSLDRLSETINEALLTQGSCEPAYLVAPLLTKQEERVLSLWMEGDSNQKIASKLCINGKTVYTYKRNIRMKLHMDTRYSPFLSLPEYQLDGTAT